VGLDKNPLVSVIIVNWNGEQFLSRCLEALKAQSFNDFELIFIDNASTDRSLDLLESILPGANLIELQQNIGFANANNIGANASRGRWLALLNNDAYPATDWLEQLIDATEKYPEYSFFASQILVAAVPTQVESTGDVFHVSGNAWHRDHHRTIEQSHREYSEVFSACAAAALYDREIFIQAGGFDERYFSHHEDVDLGFRFQLQGHRCLYVPDARVEHIGSASFGVESDKTIYQVHRNSVWTYFKNMPGRLFWKYLPSHLFGNIVFLFFYSLRGQGKAIWKAKIDAIHGLPDILKERQTRSEAIKIVLDEFDQRMDHTWLGPYLLGRRSGKLRQINKDFGFSRD
jgi:GT2 family glycosyltransferase